MPTDLLIALPFFIWVILRFAMPAGPYNMDPCGKGTFFPHLILYSVFGYAQVVLGIFGATWGFGHGANWPAAVLLFAALYAFLFAGLLTYLYERFMTGYATGGPLLAKSNYTLTRYAMVLSLGFSSVILLIVGGAWMALELGR